MVEKVLLVLEVQEMVDLVAEELQKVVEMGEEAVILLQ